jgi:hypothetical protein
MMLAYFPEGSQQILYLRLMGNDTAFSEDLSAFYRCLHVPRHQISNARAPYAAIQVAINAFRRQVFWPRRP